MVTTSQIRGQILAVLFLALIVWSLYPRYHLHSSILVMTLLGVFQVSFSLEEFYKSLSATYGESGIWIIISGFILAKGMETSGLGRRIALRIATSMGNRPDKIVLAVALTNLAIAPLSPSTTAKAFLLLPICIGLVETFHLEKGWSNYGTAVMLMAMAANNICSTAYLTATVPNPISAGYLKTYTGINLDWLGWLRMGFPITVLLLGASWLICTKMFKPDVKVTLESDQRVKDLRRELGPLSRGEKTVAIIFSLALLLWISEKFLGLYAGLLSLSLSLLLFIPNLGVMQIRGFTGSVPWGSIALFLASMSLAKAVGQWRALDPVALNIFNFLKLSEMQPMLFTSIMVLVAMFLHVGFTSTTVYTTVVVPLVISITQLQGLQPQMVALPVAFLAPIAVILPVNTIPNIVFYMSGYFTQRQIAQFGLVMSLVSALLILFVGIPYWMMIGLI